MAAGWKRLLAMAALVVLVLAVPPGNAAEASASLRFGVITLNHPLMMYRHYLPFTDYVSRHSGVHLELVLARNYEAIIRDLLDGELDFALLGGLTYIEARQASKDVVPLCAILSPDGTPSNRTVLFTRSDRSDISTIKDLTGKRFAFASIHSTSGYLEPLCYLGRHGVQPRDFATVDNLRTHESVVRSVLRGAHDAGAISRFTFDQFKAQGLKPVDVTGKHPGFVIVGLGKHPDAQRTLREFLLGLNVAAPEVKIAIANWSPLLRNGFSEATDADYDSIRRLLDCAAQFGYGSRE